MNRFIIFVLALSFVACEKNLSSDAIPVNGKVSQVETMEDLVVPSNFEWETAKEIDVTIISPISQMVALTDQDGNVIQKMWLNAGQEFFTSLTLPSYQANINAIANSGTETIALNSNHIEIQL